MLPSTSTNPCTSKKKGYGGKICPLKNREAGDPMTGGHNGSSKKTAGHGVRQIHTTNALVHLHA